MKSKFQLIGDKIYRLEEERDIQDLNKYIDLDETFNDSFIIPANNGVSIISEKLKYNEYNSSINLINPPYCIPVKAYKVINIFKEDIVSNINELYNVIISDYLRCNRIHDKNILLVVNTINDICKLNKKIDLKDIVINESNLDTNKKIYIHIDTISIDMSIQSLFNKDIMALELGTKLMHINKYDKTIPNVDQLEIGFEYLDKDFYKIYIVNDDIFEKSEDIYIELHKNLMLSTHRAKYELYEKYLEKLYYNMTKNI